MLQRERTSLGRDIFHTFIGKHYFHVARKVKNHRRCRSFAGRSFSFNHEADNAEPRHPECASPGLMTAFFERRTVNKIG